MILPEEIKNTIKESVDLESLLVYLGFKIVRSNSSELRAPCIIHGGDNPTAFSLRVETRKWKCFTKKCEMTSSGKVDNDLVSLVMKTQGLSFIEALQFLSDFAGLGIDVRSGNFEMSPDYEQGRDIKKFIRRASKLRKQGVSPSKISESVISTYKSQRDDFFIKEGFLPDTLDYFDVGSTSRYGIPSASIPIRDSNGQLVGLSLRRTDSNEDPRYRLEWEFEKDKFLYNFSSAKRIGKNYIIIVEGFKACWSVYESGHPNVIACMGSVITDGQVSLLLSSDIAHCILMLDGDSAGRSGMEASIQKLEKMDFKVVPAYLEDGVSPDDISREELKEFLNMYVAAI